VVFSREAAQKPVAPASLLLVDRASSPSGGHLPREWRFPGPGRVKVPFRVHRSLRSLRLTVPLTGIMLPGLSDGPGLIPSSDSGGDPPGHESPATAEKARCQRPAKPSTPEQHMGTVCCFGAGRDW
jgi:hypothetical protein